MSTVGCPSFVDGTATMRRANRPIEPTALAKSLRPHRVALTTPGTSRACERSGGDRNAAAAPDEPPAFTRSYGPLVWPARMARSYGWNRPESKRRPTSGVADAARPEVGFDLERAPRGS